MKYILVLLIVVGLAIPFLPCPHCEEVKAADPWKALRTPYQPAVVQPVRKHYDLRPDVPEDQYGRKTYIQQ